MIAVFIRFKRCRVRLIPYNFYYFDGGGGDEEYNIIILYIRRVYYIIYCPPRGNRSHYYNNNNCKLLFFSRQPDLSFLFLSLPSLCIHLCFPRLTRVSTGSVYRNSRVRTLDYYTAPIIPRLHPSHAASPARHLCDGRRTLVRPVPTRIHTILHRPKSRDSTRVSYGRTRSRARKPYSHRRS